MKNLNINTALIAILIFFLSSSLTRAEVTTVKSYSPLITILPAETNLLFTELICNAQFKKSSIALPSKDIAEERELFMEENLEMEKWMLNYNWIEKNEVITEEELKLEVWMRSPTNWNTNLYQ